MAETGSNIFSPVNILASGSLFAAALWLGWWFYDHSKYLYVTDARIASTMISVSSRMPGWVVDFSVDEGQQVAKGDVLVIIDARDTDLQILELEASLNTKRREYERLQKELSLRVKQVDSGIEVARSRHETAKIELSESRVLLAQAISDFERADSLLEQKMISEETWESRRTDRDVASQALNLMKAKVATSVAELKATEISVAEIDILQHELLIVGSEEAELKVQRNRLQSRLGDFTIKSPIKGVIDETFTNEGEYVYPGQRILMVHNPEVVWIKANIKETNINLLHEGAHVEVQVDAYPDEVFSATISNIGNAATSAFALLPSPNPSGNFTKTTQRLEVKIDIGPHENLLKPGMMVELKIDTH